MGKPKGSAPTPASWKKGQSGNPKGNVDKSLTEAHRYNKREMEQIFNRYLNLTFEDLQKLEKDQTLLAKDLLAIKIIVQGIKTSDPYRFNFILDRLIGKVKDQIDIEIHQPVVITRPSGEQVILTTKPKEITHELEKGTDYDVDRNTARDPLDRKDDIR